MINNLNVTNIILVLALAFSLLIVLFLFIDRLIYFKSSKELKKELESDAYIDSLRIIEDAHAQALTIINEAKKKSLDQVKSVKDFDESFYSSFDNSLETLLHNYKANFEALSKKVRMKFEKDISALEMEEMADFKSVVSQASQDVNFEIDEIRRQIARTFKHIDSELQEKTSKSFDVFVQELEKYKQTKIAETDIKISEIIEKVSIEVLKEAISVDSHKRLITKKLSEISKETFSH